MGKIAEGERRVGKREAENKSGGVQEEVEEKEGRSRRE